MAVRAVDGVRRVNSVASEGMASVTIQLLLGADQDRVVSDVTNQVNRITTFPLDAEEPTISALTSRQPVISLILAGERAAAMYSFTSSCRRIISTFSPCSSRTIFFTRVPRMPTQAPTQSTLES